MEAGWEEPTEEEAVVGSSTAAEQVKDILQALPERDREVLTCRFLLNLSTRETAVRMGLTETNVKVVQFRALKRASQLKGVDVKEQRQACL